MTISEVNFETVSTLRPETSPVAEALAGLRANEARYLKNKYGHAFAVRTATEARATVDWVHRVHMEDRYLGIGLRLSGRPSSRLNASASVFLFMRVGWPST